MDTVDKRRGHTLFMVKCSIHEYRSGQKRRQGRWKRRQKAGREVYNTAGADPDLAPFARFLSRSLAFLTLPTMGQAWGIILRRHVE